MARIREIVPSTQRIRPHKVEDAVTCQYKVITDESDGTKLVHLSTFGSDQRESSPKSSQSLQLTLENAAALMNILSTAFGFSWRTQPAGAADESPAEIPDATKELAASLYVSKEWLQECVDLLRDRPQLIFYGPPGTGKTYLAKAISRHLSRPENIRIVQFHPSYSYEDFFEGFRPTQSVDGQLGYHLHWGPLRLLAKEARNNPGQIYTLIVDEINRGNLAKIFGELYYLLEYRNESIDLLYSDKVETFRLPPNVVILGTMNSADRSIALLDSAMRRRFSFVLLHPSEEPTKSMLRKWLDEQNRDHEPADVLDVLNSMIEDHEFKIGPSYFMRASTATKVGMDIAWRTSILPSLEEHHYGDPNVDVHDRYALDAIRERLADRRE
ncbi:AAA family ATPase [Nocardia sp. NPDC004654]|uniref:McrB family protein n=1 Tax=Nocardia sp. NPDC004654 TaxID=3154776 RepID=UPI0033A96868